MKLALALLTALLLAPLIALHAAETPASKPNIIVIFTDLLPCHASENPTVKSPDRLTTHPQILLKSPN